MQWTAASPILVSPPPNASAWTPPAALGLMPPDDEARINSAIDIFAKVSATLALHFVLRNGALAFSQPLPPLAEGARLAELQPLQIYAEASELSRLFEEVGPVVSDPQSGERSLSPKHVGLLRKIYGGGSPLSQGL